jgi:hypothetical protein
MASNQYFYNSHQPWIPFEKVISLVSRLTKYVNLVLFEALNPVTSSTVVFNGSSPRYFWKGSAETLGYASILHRLNRAMDERGEDGNYDDFNAELIQRTLEHLSIAFSQAKFVCSIRE